jgi:hypothetical protein
MDVTLSVITNTPPTQIAISRRMEQRNMASGYVVAVQRNTSAHHPFDRSAYPDRPKSLLNSS